MVVLSLLLHAKVLVGLHRVCSRPRLTPLPALLLLLRARRMLGDAELIQWRARVVRMEVPPR